MFTGAMLLVGAGCDSLGVRSQKPTATPPVTAAPLTKETINLDESEIFLRTRDDVAPGQAEVTRQSLFAKSRDGQIVELVKDVHEALKGTLRDDFYLVLKKDVPTENLSNYLYFTQGGGVSAVHKLFVFNKTTRTFDENAPLVSLENANSFAAVQFSPDNTKVALFIQVELQEKRSTPVVYIGNLLSGEVTNRYVVGHPYSITITPDAKTNTNGAIPVVHPATKWSTDSIFKIALLKPDGSDGDARTPVDVVNVLVSEAPTSLATSTEYQWDPVAKRLFGQHEDGFDISVGLTESLTENFITTDHILPKVSLASPFVYVLGRGRLGGIFVKAIYDKTNHQFVARERIPLPLLSDIQSANLSPSGTSLAIFGPRSETNNPSSEVVNVIHLVTLQLASYAVPSPYTALARYEYMTSSKNSLIEYGILKWKGETELSYGLYERGPERAMKRDNTRIEAVNKFVRREKIKIK